MNMGRYEFKAGRNFITFEFISEGIKGPILKLVRFDETDYKDIFNLSFGDKNIIVGGIDDTIVSNNGDREKVLATVVATIYNFTNKKPHAWVYATGSTKSRNRLYRMGISKFLEEAEKDFEIFGRINNKWELFAKNVNYDAFLIKRKFAKFEI